MKTSRRLLQVGFLAFVVATLLSCGTGSSFAPNNNGPKPNPVVSVSLTEGTLTMSGGETHQFAATVKGSTNTGVTWALTDCTGDTCGSISSSGLYTAPPVISTKVQLSITATAEADPNKVASATISLMPIEVSISPANGWVVPGGTQAFTAVVKYDHLNAGVTWALDQACSDNCGTLSNIGPASVTYAAPLAAPDSSPTKLTATSVSDPSKKAETPLSLGEAGGMIEGDYAFLFSGWETTISDGSCWVCEVITAGRFHADAEGHITQGVEDINSLSAVVKALPFTGTYMIGVDGRGTFTFVSSQGTATYHMVLDVSKTKGRFIRYDARPDESSVSGSGYFEMQDKAVFSLAALAGPYAIGVSGSLGANRQAIVGRFDANASGIFTGGSADMAQQVHAGGELQNFFPNLSLTGFLAAPSASTGRGTATLDWGSLYHFAYYVISDQKILLVQIDTRNDDTPLLRGQLARQKGPFSAASFSTPAIFSMAGGELCLCGFLVQTSVGQIIPDGSGSVTGVYDDNWGRTDLPFTGSYTVASNGRSDLTLKTVSADNLNHVGYFFSANEAFLLQTSGWDVLFGRFKGQTAGPFSEASLNGTYLTYSGPPTGDLTESFSGLTTFDGLGGLTSTMDVDSIGNLFHFDFYGTYAVAPNGRGTGIFSAPAAGSAVFWIISPTEVAGVGAITGDPGEFGSLLGYEKQEVAASTDVP